MKKNIIINGLIAGAIVTWTMTAAMVGLIKNLDCDGGMSGMLLGYSTMLVAFSLIFVGVKNYRDKYNGGTITFGKAFKIGLFITLIASTIYVLVWMIDYYYFIPDFFDKYTAHQLKTLRASGASGAELKAKIADMQSMGAMYKKPLFNAMFTYIEILPVGLLVSVICAAILRRKDTGINLAVAN